MQSQRSFQGWPRVYKDSQGPGKVRVVRHADAAEGEATLRHVLEAEADVDMLATPLETLGNATGHWRTHNSQMPSGGAKELCAGLRRRSGACHA